MPTARETEVPVRRRSKRLSYSPASHPTWVIIHETGARDDDSNGDDRAMSVTSSGDLICVSFVLTEPPRISFLAVDVPQRPRPTEPIRSDVKVLAAHRDVVLFEMKSRSTFDPAPDDYFVYRASCGASGKPSLLLLPVQYYERQMIAGRPVQHLMRRGTAGILSFTSKEQDASFVVADLRWVCPESQRFYNDRGPRRFDLHVMWSGSDKWMVFKNLHIRGAKRGRELAWWSTDAVVPYSNRFLIWVDYFQGVIFADFARPEKKPDLWYVPLPVVPLRKDPSDMEKNGGPGYPDTSRNLCVTRSGLKFVSVDHQRSTSIGVRHWKSTCTFWITIWSLRDDGVTWRRDERLYAEDLWALDSKNRFPHVEPKFPIVNMENPNAVCFVVEEDHIISGSPRKRGYMVEIDMRKKVLLAVADYSKEPYLFCLDSVKIATELRSYLYSGEACKKRRQ